MPELDGYTVCQKIREFSNVPIIMLTALGETEDLIKGLDAGADDYVTKPVSVKELLARVRAALRRSKLTNWSTCPNFETGSLRVDFVSRRVFVHDEEINLTLTEYRLLKELVTQAERVVTPPQLLEKIWGPGYEELHPPGVAGYPPFASEDRGQHRIRHSTSKHGQVSVTYSHSMTSLTLSESPIITAETTVGVNAPRRQKRGFCR